ncbi:IclR family transcriptional regulator [Rhodococcus sp. ABRD24]|uniref:IclR family transcriptional regulator n=1 Tax=Rhodococcus sp. ABRD24 TaxID=2507582 RepID=UPI00103AD423|nr:IclR family transcriptional regulator [Rhodococcus sp. ABRD24]QBJ96281.1 IclR family transcriptional regulator [Rhodococcus sp. ABRD24]
MDDPSLDAVIDRNTVLGKVVTVLRAFTIDDHGVSLAELGRRTDIPKGTLHRVVSDLVAVRLLDRTPSGYRLSGQLFELGMRASVERSLIEVATPFMEDLYERTHETVHIGVLEGSEVVYVSKIGGHRQATSPSRVGGRMPLHCTAIGKAMLAHSEPAAIERVLRGRLERRTPRTLIAPGVLRTQLERIAREGVAYEFEESAVGITCVAAPVLDADDRPIAALSVTGTVGRFRPELHAASVRAAAAGVGATLARRAHLAEGSRAE